MYNSEYYNNGPYAPVKVIDAYDLNFDLGCVIKYVLRAGNKPGEDKLKDLKKAYDYLGHEIEKLENKEG